MVIEEILPPERPKPAEAAEPQTIDDKMRELVRLRDEGVLTYEQFAFRKADLLAQS